MSVERMPTQQLVYSDSGRFVMLSVSSFPDGMMRSQILWIGSEGNGHSRAEFAPIYNELSQHHKVYFVSGLSESAPAAELVVIAPSRPGQFSSSCVKILQASRPHAKFVYVLGDWCCGQKRTESEHTRVPTFYCHELQRGNVFAQLNGELTSPSQSGHAFAAVYSRTSSYGDAIQEMLATSSLGSVQLRFGDGVPTDGAAVVIWETPMEGYHREAQLAEIEARHPAAQVIALVTFPRDYETAAWLDASVSVLSQPFRESDLVRQIRWVCDSDPQRTLRISA